MLKYYNEQLKQHGLDNVEFWYARDFQTALDYGSWDKFKRVIQKAMMACGVSEQPIEDHFSQVG